MNRDSTTPSPAEIEELIAYLPILYRPGFVAVQAWKENGLLPYPKYAPEVDEFFRLASKDCWDDLSYEPVAAGRMLDNVEEVRSASIAAIRTMLTYCVRGERFCDGHWGAMIESGKIRAILERLGAILRQDAHYSL
jgi:hypothetical protein